MTSLLFISIWPALLSRELLNESVEIAGLSVKTWFVEEPNTRVQKHLNQAECLVLPEVKVGTWQCLTSNVIYSWDYSVQPSVWSESRRTGNPHKPYRIHWNGVEMTVETNRQALFLIYRQVQQEATGSHIYLEQQFQGSFVYGWKRAGRDYVVSAWRNDDGSNFIVRLNRKDVR